MLRKIAAACVIVLAFAGPTLGFAQPAHIYDILTEPTNGGTLKRILGSTGNGQSGVPVAGPYDIDGDGHKDFSIAHLTASPLGRNSAGEIEIIFGDGSVDGVIDPIAPRPDVLRIYGEDILECAGVEVWIDDVTGDGLGDLMIGRQNHTPGTRTGAGALSIVIGGAWTRTMAAALTPLDLANVPASAKVFTVLGARGLDRLGVWMRAGDVTGDGVADALVAADQADGPGGESNAGEVYLIQGGAHLAQTAVVDLAQFGSTILEGAIARIRPPAPAAGFHFGATCHLLDLDDDGRAEVVASATINRASAAIPAYGAASSTAQASGGAPRGRVFIAWADNFTTPTWPAGFTVDLGAPPGTRTVISGATYHYSLGEELAAGDFDGDGGADFFVGDLVADASENQDRATSGVGHVLYDAAGLRGLSFNMDSVPAQFRTTMILGPSSGAIGADTIATGDFDADGFEDLAFCSPKDSPLGRIHAGSAHVFFGQSQGWPARIDTAPGALPGPEIVRITEIRGAKGTTSGGQGVNFGDTIAYSASSGDMDGDGRTDLIINEMLGDGSTEALIDVGNLLVINGRGLEPKAATQMEILDLLLGERPPEGRLFDINQDGEIDIADALGAM